MWKEITATYVLKHTSAFLFVHGWYLFLHMNLLYIFSYLICDGGGPMSILRNVFISEYLENVTYSFLNQTHCVAWVRIASKIKDGFFAQNMTEDEDATAKLLCFVLVVVDTTDAQ